MGPGSHLFYGGAGWGLSRDNIARFDRSVGGAEASDPAEMLRGERATLGWNGEPSGWPNC
ncbi:MAG: hypothetical protein R3B96_07195 [Pirellulaceae bacterium]